LEACLVAVQTKAKAGRVPWNLTHTENLIESVRANFIEDRTVICLPELFATGYDLSPSAFAKLAETIPGPTVDTLSNWAQKFRAYICGGLPEKEEGKSGDVYDSTILVSPEGKLLGRYRKIHLAGDHERGIFKPGRGLPVIQTALGRMGLLICYDQVFPEPTRRMAFQGTDIILHSSAWSTFPHKMDWGSKEYDIFSITRAMENAVFFVSSNRTGTEGKFKFVGRTRIIAPWGKVLASREREEGCALARVNLDLLQQSRSVHPCLEEERRAVYRV
jgi:predicted amidohydrolase